MSRIGDGTCAVEISHKEGTFGDIASGDEIVRAALNILGSCVANPKHEGGLVKNLGAFLCGKLCLYCASASTSREAWLRTSLTCLPAPF